MACTTTALAQRNIRKAEKLYARGLFTQAIDLYAAEYNASQNPFAAARIGESYLAMREFSKALEWYNKLVQANAIEDSDRFNYGYILKAFGRYDEAHQQFKAYLTAFPADTAAARMANSCGLAQDLADSLIFYRAEPAHDLNAAGADHSPVYFQNGVAFVSSRAGADNANNINPGTGRPHTDVYYSNSLADKTYTTPALLPGNLNTIMSEGPVAFTASQDTIYYTQLVNPDGVAQPDRRGRHKYKLFRAVYRDGVWGEVAQMPFCEGDEAHYMHPALNRDGTRLFFSSNRHGTFGGFDLWVSEWFNGRWGDPYNLGPTVNTEGQEGYPFVHQDNTLYFSSDLREGFGGYDVFAAHERFAAWTNIENLRLGVNSAMDDYGLLLSGDKTEGFVSSNRDGDDNLYFIFRVNVPKTDQILMSQQLVADAQSSVGSQENENPNKHNVNEGNPQYLVVAGKVVEMLAQRSGNNWERAQGAIMDNALIVLMNEATGRTEQSATTGPNGTYAFEVQNPDNYVLMARKQGHFAARVPLAPNLDFNRMTIQLEKIVINEPNPNGMMPNVQYAFNSSVLPAGHEQALASIATILTDNPELVLELAGHACPIGNANYNQRLSEHRSKAVLDYMVNRQKVAANRLIVRGYGETRLLYPNPQTEREYALNRRTEFIVRSVSGSVAGATAMQPVQASGASAQTLAVVQRGPVVRQVANNRQTSTEIAATPNTGARTARNGIYVVREGDTLFSIGQAFGIPLHSLRSLNRLDGNNIRVGQRLRVIP